MKKYALLILSLLLGSFLRLYQLSSVPNGLTWDEAAIGYNAFSILKTGRDEHGAFLPIVFKSFGDYKPGAYIYLTVPSVAVFGLNEFAVRLPSALAGILTIYGVFLLTNQLFPKKQIGGYTALAVAVSPWLVHFSHGAWEVNVFTCLTVFGLYFFQRFLDGQSALYPSLFFVCISLAMYQASKLLTPLIFLLFITLNWTIFWSRLRPYLEAKRIIATTPFLIFILWVFIGSFFGNAGHRLSRLNIFNYKPVVTDELLEIDSQKRLVTGTFHNLTRRYLSLIGSRYLYHFSPEVLFYEGPLRTMRGHIPGQGVLGPIEIVWLIFGFAFLAQSITKGSHDLPEKATLLIFGMLLIAPIPASLTLEDFSTVRGLFMAVPLALISGLGMYFAFKKLKLWLLPVALLYLLLTCYTFDLYFNHSQTAFATEFNYGYKQAVQAIKNNPAKKVVFTDVYGQPYIYYLFYTAYDPHLYQQNQDFIDGGLDVGRVGHVGNVYFHQFGNGELNISKDTLFIGSEGNIDNNFNVSHPNIEYFNQINTPDGHTIFRIAKTKS